ncbi:MAG: sulfatase-like hydrolase/transferase [Alphaproteobacteria bacterium]|nr:sulfatase-like hydrolase/transferase [Alphaproteobacteria bacterium]
MLLPLLFACAPQPPPAVLLVTLDTTRADHLGSYGYMLAETPNLDQLAADGARFARAYSSAPLTTPSHSTIMTGRAPPTHGVRDNGDFILPDDELTLAERLSAAGWDTAAFTAAFPTQARFGLAQGFDVYSDRLDRQPDQLDWSDHRRADVVVDDAIATLRDRADADRPLFVWVHLFDAHAPYEPPEPWASRHREQPYDGEIAFADAQVGRLLAWWDEARPDSVVVVTADHGEGLGDGGELTHGFLLHDPTMRVPLLVRTRGTLPGETDALPRLRGGAVFSDPVGHVDIVPTVLALVGLPGDGRLQGADLRQGGSDRIYSEAVAGWRTLGLSSLRAETTAAGRYVEGAHGRFHPASGDLITTTALPPRPGDAASLADLVAVLGDAQATGDGLSLDDTRRLAALGYVGDDLPVDTTIDPEDVIDVIPLTWRARQALERRDFRQATEDLALLEARLGRSYAVRRLEALTLFEAGELERAYEALVDCQLEHPTSDTAFRLGFLAEQAGDLDDAQDWFRDALALDPQGPAATAALTRTAAASGDREEARTLADEGLARHPDHGELRTARAMLRWEEGDFEGALADARIAIEEQPRSTAAWQAFALASWEAGSPEDAVDALRIVLQEDPEHLGARITLTGWLLELGRNAEALRTLDQAARAARAGRLPSPVAREVLALADEVDSAVAAELGNAPRTGRPDSGEPSAPPAGTP